MMVKSGPLFETPRTKNGSIPGIHWILIATVALWVLFSHYWPSVQPFISTPFSTPEIFVDVQKHVSWGHIQPLKSIQWHDCFRDFHCARLEVPIDWKNKSNERTAEIAIIKLPAKVNVTDERYGGPVLLNPGGPGGSGVRLALTIGKMLQGVIDASASPNKNSAHDDTGLYFDVIGFDPRGVNNTTPSASCFPNESTQQAFNIQKTALGIISDGSLSFNSVWNQVQAVSGTCSHHVSGLGQDAVDVGRYMSTPQVVEDMVAIVEALGEWREKAAWELVAHKSCILKRKLTIGETNRWKKGKEMVQYLGFSYGTILGATLATLHPDRVKRVVIDGVADMDDYYAGTWLSNLQDTDLIMKSFYQDCHSAGPDKCAVYSKEGPQGTEAIVEKVLAELRDSPTLVRGTDVVAPDIVTWSDLMGLIRDAMYKPHQLFPKLAQVVHELSLEPSNGTILAVIKQSAHQPFCPTQKCERDGPWSRACQHSALHDVGSEVSALIHCTDAPNWTGRSIDFHREKWSMLRNESRWLSDYWAEITMYCSDLSIRPSWRFGGDNDPVNGTSRQLVGANTSHPILLTSNVRDPVTPLRNAHKISARFNGSAVLEQDDDGHCAFSAPSLCAAKVLKDYFQTGKVPENGTRCERDVGPFDGQEEDGSFIDALSEEDRKVYALINEMRKVKRHKLWLGI